MLRTLPEKQKSRPFFLLFTRTPRLPIDIMFGLRPPEGYSTYAEYVKKWRQAMKEAYDLASAHAKKSSESGKQRYDKTVRHTAVKEGDRVLVRNTTERGPQGSSPLLETTDRCCHSTYEETYACV